MQKKLGICIAALLCLALLGGCGKTAAPPPDTTAGIAGTDAAGADIANASTGTAEPTEGTTIQETSSSNTETGNPTTTTITTTQQKVQSMLNTQKFTSPAEGANDFAFRLSKALLQNNGKKNFVSSPYSVWLPLAALVNATRAEHKPALLAALGAAGFSEKDLNDAAAEMLNRLTNEHARGYDRHNPLRIANAIFIDKRVTLKKSFANTFAQSYMGSAMQVDFLSPSAVKTVNDWASKQTEGLIDNIIQEFDPTTVAAIANAIYFSDRWSWEFDLEKTKKDTFHGMNGDRDAYFMLREGNSQPYYEDSKLQATLLKFTTNGGLCILLPKDGNANKLLSSMTTSYFDRIQEEASPRTGKLLLPRFKIDSGAMKLQNSLEALGVPLFDPAAAPLTGGLIEENIGVYVGDAVQKAMIEVDEKGTTAAAVTVIMTYAASAMPTPTKPFEMVCDKPFAFVLYGSGGQILFTGVVNQV